MISPASKIQIDPFFQVPSYVKTTRSGKVQLPVLYKDSSCLHVILKVKTSLTKSLLVDSGLTPALKMGQHTLLSLSAFEHRHSTLGTYSAVHLTLPSLRKTGFYRRSGWRELIAKGEQRHMAFLLLQSVNNTAAINSAGKEIWGFPKQMANIDIVSNRQVIGFEVRDSDNRKTMLSFGGMPKKIMPFPAFDLTLYSQSEYGLHRTVINARGKYNFHLPLGFRIELGDSDSPLTRTLRQLQIEDARILSVLNTHKYQARMNEGVLVESLDDL